MFTESKVCYLSCLLMSGLISEKKNENNFDNIASSENIPFPLQSLFNINRDIQRFDSVKGRQADFEF